MKKLIYLLTICLSFQLAAQDDDGYIMYQTIELTPKSGHYQQLMDGLKAHNKKYHTEGAETVNVWTIQSGPKSGTMIWVKGPLTWTDYDTPMTDDHMDDWMKNVDPHADMGEWGHWRRSNSMTYTPEGSSPTVMRIRYFDILPEKGNNARHIISSLFKVSEEHKLDVGLHVFYNQAPGVDGKEWAVLWMHDNWASMDKDRDFWDKYEEMFGDDSRQEWFEGWREATDFKGGELRVLNQELSAAGNNND